MIRSCNKVHIIDWYLCLFTLIIIMMTEKQNYFKTHFLLTNLSLFPNKINWKPPYLYSVGFQMKFIFVQDHSGWTKKSVNAVWAKGHLIDDHAILSKDLVTQNEIVVVSNPRHPYGCTSKLRMCKITEYHPVKIK